MKKQLVAIASYLFALMCFLSLYWLISSITLGEHFLFIGQAQDNGLAYLSMAIACFIPGCPLLFLFYKNWHNGLSTASLLTIGLILLWMLKIHAIISLLIVLAVFTAVFALIKRTRQAVHDSLIWSSIIIISSCLIFMIISMTL